MAKQRNNGAGRALLMTGLVVAGVGAGYALIRANQDKLPANIREFNKRYTNPMMLRSIASGKRANLGVIIHQGRTSGRQFETPVRIDATVDGYLIPMPYGIDTDWLKNVMAAGGATLRFHGQEVATDEPAIISTEEALKLLPSSAQVVARMMRIQHYLRLRRADLFEPVAGADPLAEDRPAQ